MLKKIIIGGLVIIALLGALLVWETFKERGAPKRPDSLINKDDNSLSNSIANAFGDTNESNVTTIEEVTVVVPVAPKEKKEKPKKEDDSGYVAGNDTIDDNNNIYINDASSQSEYVPENIAQDKQDNQKIDTELKESLDDIRSKVQRKINNSSSLNGSTIDVSTSERGIVLSGTVTSAKQKVLAGSIANSASENATVANKLKVVVPDQPQAPKESEVQEVAAEQAPAATEKP